MQRVTMGVLFLILLASAHAGFRSGRIEPQLKNRGDVLFYCDFESDAWHVPWKITSPRNTELVKQDTPLKFKPFQGQALRILYPKGKHYGTTFSYSFRKHTGKEPEEIYFRYYIRFAESWEAIKGGGKLPGISGTYWKAGWGGRPANGTNGWSMRGLFKGHANGDTAIGFYAYHADMKGKYGADWIWDKKRAVLKKNKWYCVEQHIKLNTPKKNDGIARGWIDGKLAFERKNARFRDVARLKIEKIWIDFYVGGSWTGEQDQHIYIDNLVIARSYIGPAKK